MPVIISNNLLGKIPLLDTAVIRINLAWIKDYEAAQRLLNESRHQIYLDYPDGRKKPPRPKISLTEAIELSHHPKVSYFAISNAEDIEKLTEIKGLLDCELVPKIETTKGVEIIPKMIDMGIKTIMLDGEDLYTDVDCDGDKYEQLKAEVRTYKDKITVLELQGVVFI